MFDLAMASLNLQIIAMGVFMGMVTAWIARCVWRRFVASTCFCARTIWAFLRKKYLQYQKPTEVVVGE
jgi:hypothetical protein